MEFVISFLEGIITFVSPCLLPMLPMYLFYFAGGEEGSTKKTLINALGFCLGFTAVFVLLGVFASAIGAFLRDYQVVLNIVTGLIVVFFGLNIMGVFKFGFFNMEKRLSVSVEPLGFFRTALFGMVFAFGWTPCVGAFLGSALMLASQQGSVAKGSLLLLVYSLGLAVPFVLSALLIERLRGAFDLIKRNYKIITTVCGALLVALGILMMTGLMSRLLTAFGG